MEPPFWDPLIPEPPSPARAKKIQAPGFPDRAASPRWGEAGRAGERALPRRPSRELLEACQLRSPLPAPRSQRAHFPFAFYSTMSLHCQ